MDGDKTDGSNEPAHEPAHKPGSLKPGAQNFDGTVSGGFIVNVDTGEVAENPLAIRDPVKHDQSAMYSKKIIIWCSCLMVLGLEGASIYGQLFCTPARTFEPNIYLMGLVAGVFFGLSVNLIEKMIEAWEDWRRGK